MNRYSIVKMIQADRAICVYQVMDETTGKQYLCKRISYQEDPRLIHQFRTEIDVLSLISDPFVPELVEAFEDEKDLFCVETYIHGAMLHVWKKQHPIKTIRFRKRFILELYRLIELVHQVDYVYVDIKPQNVLVKNEHIYLIDFNSCVPKDASFLMSVSSFNFLQEKNKRGFLQDSYGFLQFIRYLYPWNPFFKFMRVRSFKKMKRAYLCRFYFRHSLTVLCITCLSLFGIQDLIMPYSKDLSLYFHQPTDQHFYKAYRSSKENGMQSPLYLWIEQDWLGEQLFSSKDVSLFLLKESIRTEDASICSYIVKRIPKKQQNMMMEQMLQAYQIMGQIPSKEWRHTFSLFVIQKRRLNEGILWMNYLLENTCTIASSDYNALMRLFAQSRSKLDKDQVFGLAEYGLFLKSKQQRDIRIPQELFNQYEGDEKWDKLIRIWEESE